ncbi:cytochrome c oxidase accessory protein FixG [Catalinimonas alkaloidigena]|uniref:cytochrome c oxidase accessory protein CcoG n=1 Tax=Catalinimonas alkaloidigena TaxID=1075417 RepID=UPI002405F951|nr:cytochrome c oxidase accessory protein CcoG [Catalinimonas alkaloidigena]MDF9795996.1 cytochrome c oxidase accessory protein FixG [Catalinimonas alkaloidigena]
MAAIDKQSDEEVSFRDRISTVDASGKRVWIYPKKPRGKFYNARTLVSVVLLAILFAGPFIKIDGEPLLLLNILERKFVIFGQIFWPQDFYLFVFATLVLVVFIILFTVVYGRIFCGWVCPQTIFMEMVFRRIEYWIEGDYTAQRKLDRQAWNQEKIIKKTSKHIIFFAIAFLIGNTFLAYIIGIEELENIVTDSPAEHIGGLSAMLLFSFVFYFVFAKFREQVCTNVCPYGRLQGVLLDRKSVVVAYDYKRGEPRAKFRKGENRDEAGKGDCIDCHQCVQVCPTGIDIRNGTQLECVNCTACIDACDNIMEKVGLPKKLIRYASEENIAEGKKFHFTARSIAYSVVLVFLAGVLGGLLVLRTDVETSILRTPGMLYQDQGDNKISNLYNIKIINKTNDDMPIHLELLDEQGSIQMVGNKNLFLEKQGVAESALFVIFDRKEIEKMKTEIVIGVYSGEELIEKVNTNFLGPAN